MNYREFWRRAVWNYVLATLISVVPAFAFYSVAYAYTVQQVRWLLVLGIPALAVMLTVDLLVLRAVLRPIRRALEPGASAADEHDALERLLALPVLVLPRVFGPHVFTATLVLNVLVVWANRTHGLGIPASQFPIYWLLNLTVVPVGHVVFEYSATERLIRQPLARLLERLPHALDPRRLVRFPLAARIFLFSALLGLAPIGVGGIIAYERTQAAGVPFPLGFAAQLAGVGAALALLWLLLLALVSREVGEQTRAITAALDRIAAGELETNAPIGSISEFGRIAAAVNEMAAGLRERQQIRDLFGAFLSRDVAARLLDPRRLAATERRQVTVLFLDLRDFTALSARIPAETVVELLNLFFGVAVEAIAEERGHVNKFLGDGLLAVFGAPVALDDHPDRALRAALEIRRRLAEMNRALEASRRDARYADDAPGSAPEAHPPGAEAAAGGQLPLLRMGAAIHTGEAIVGTIGSPQHKLEYTVVGEAVNLASRIEGLNKQFGTDILLSRETREQLKDSFPLKPLGATDVRGIPRPVELFTV